MELQVPLSESIFWMIVIFCVISYLGICHLISKFVDQSILLTHQTHCGPAVCHFVSLWIFTSVPILSNAIFFLFLWFRCACKCLLKGRHALLMPVFLSSLNILKLATLKFFSAESSPGPCHRPDLGELLLSSSCHLTFWVPWHSPWF